MFDWNPKAQNAIFLDENTGGKGRYFKARFLQSGLVKYSFGVCVLDKETIDKFVYDFVGCPVIIDHQDVTSENAKDVCCGNIAHVWYDDKDGFYWCDGIITDETAISLINDGYNVSCQYEITEYANNTTNKLHNGNPYDKVILNGKPEHLAIVKNPRYENALIAINAIEKDDNVKEWITVKGNHIPVKEGQTKEEATQDFDTIDYYSQEAMKARKAKNSNNGKTWITEKCGTNTPPLNVPKNPPIVSNTADKKLSNFIERNKMLEDVYIANNADYDKERGSWITVKGTHVFVREGQSVGEAVKDKMADWNDDKGEGELVLVKGGDTYKELENKFVNLNKRIKSMREDLLDPDLKESDREIRAGRIEAAEKELTSIKKQLEKHPDREKNTKVKLDSAKLKKAQEDIDFVKRMLGQNKLTNFIKENNMTNFLNGLFNKGRNSQEMNKDEVKNLVFETLLELKAANEADDKDKKADNEDVDKRELIRQIMAIAGKHEDNEDVRTIAKLAEKLAYDKSEAGTADNKAKNEDGTEDKRKLIDEVGGILKGKVDNEVWRTIIGKIEKIAYKKSEAGTADNKCKNEDEEAEEKYEELKEKIEKEAENKKAKNSIEKQTAMITSALFKQEPKINYVSQKDRLALGDKLF